VLGLIQERIAAYADRAGEMADASPDAGGAGGFREIARISRRLVSEPPATFREALQWYWFYVTFERATSSGNGAFRLDQVLLPWYRADLAAGRIDERRAIDLLAALFLKEGLFYCLGGVDADGRDAVNELSWLALRAYDAIGGPSNLNVRWHAGIDAAFFAYALDLLRRRRSGVPLLVNDEVVIPSLVHFGCPLREARDYAFSGCFWWVVPGKEYPYHDMEAVSGTRMLAETLERAFRDPPATFEALLARYAEVQREHVDRFAAGLAEVDREAPRHYPEMVLSLVMDDCIERGRDVTDNGARWSLTTLRYIGLATVADSLMAIRRTVYDERSVGWPELEAALRDDFRGRERLQRLLAECPKFGNDDPEVDGIARELARSFKAELAGRRNLKGFAFRPAFYSHMGHVSEGRSLGATPDGRRAGEPVSQGPNPAQGRAVRGITAAVRSVSRIGFADTAGGPLQVHLSGSSDEAMGPALDALVRTAFGEGIVQMNVNFADRATLEDAMAHPERHWDLVIRVTGYSARFVQIGRDLQREIVSRTVF